MKYFNEMFQFNKQLRGFKVYFNDEAKTPLGRFIYFKLSTCYRMMGAEINCPHHITKRP